MDAHPLLRFFHVCGAILLGGGLAGVFISELRAYGAATLPAFVEAGRFTALLYDALVVPGALLLAASGALLVAELGFGYFDQPWLTGMWAGFAFEFVEGNTLTRLAFRRAVRISEAAPGLDATLHATARPFLARLTHFLDLPMVAAIVWCGTARPDGWGPVAGAFGLAAAAGLVLTLMVPRLATPPGRGPA